MSFRKLPDPDPAFTLFKSCKSPEHKPPSHIVLDPGTWEWKCQTCGEVTIVCVHETGNWATSDGTRGQFQGAPETDWPASGERSW